MNKEIVAGLKPVEVWKEFAKISDIPRCSKKEDAILDYIKGAASEKGFETKHDAVGNLLVMVPPTKGLENLPGLVIQGHVDMVCEQNSDGCHDFDTDPIGLVVDGEWLRANQTTLGADNGIAVAMMLALLKGNHKHGPLDLLFTVDEETGLTGALKLDPELMRYKLLLNLDSEEEDFFYIGCAGGKEVEGHLPLSFEPAPEDSGSYTIALTGFAGGHSGADIHKQLGNALKQIGRILWELAPAINIRVADLKGGDKHNAIPREAFATVSVPKKRVNDLERILAIWQETLLAEFGETEPKIKVTLKAAASLERVLDTASQTELLRLLRTMPHGISSMSRTMPGLVSTSMNLAAIRFQNGEAFILTSQRSDIQSLLDDIAHTAAAALEASGGRYIFTREYPAWTPNPHSAFLAKAVAEYKRLRPKAEVTIGAIHAGLECGVIGAKLPGTDMISLGPDIRGAHTPEEKVKIQSVERIWEFVLELLQKL